MSMTQTAIVAWLVLVGLWGGIVPAVVAYFIRKAARVIMRSEANESESYSERVYFGVMVGAWMLGGTLAILAGFQVRMLLLDVLPIAAYGGVLFFVGYWMRGWDEKRERETSSIQGERYE